jgi:hypothetical protein
MADDPLIDDKIAEIDTEDIPTRQVEQAVLDRLIPTLNDVIGQLKRLHERVLNLEGEVLGGNPRDAGDNPQLDLPPLIEALSGDTLEKLAASDVEARTGLDLAKTSDEALLGVDGIGEATLDKIREQYPVTE